MNISSDERILADFCIEQPGLARLYNNFLDYAAPQLSAMPPRFGQFAEQGLFKPGQLVSILGFDADPSKHAIKLYGVVKEMLRMDRPEFSSKELHDYYMTAIVHDMGKLNPEDDNDEITKIQDVIRVIEPDHAEEIIERTSPILKGRLHRGRDLIEWSERLGSVITGARAARIYTKPKSVVGGDPLTEPQLTALGIIATDVNRRTVPLLRGSKRPSDSTKFILSQYGYLTAMADIKFEKEKLKAHAANIL